MGADKRRQERIAIKLPVRVEVIEGGASRDLTGEIANISEGGALVKLVSPVPNKSRVRLRILWPPARTCLARGQVVWLEPGRCGLALDQVNDDFVQLVRVLAMAEPAERAEVTRLLRASVLQIETGAPATVQPAG